MSTSTGSCFRRKRAGDGAITTSSIAEPAPAPGLDASGDERLAVVREHDDVGGLDVRCRMLDQAEVVSCRGVNAVGRHCGRLCQAPGRLPSGGSGRAASSLPYPKRRLNTATESPDDVYRKTETRLLDMYTQRSPRRWLPAIPDLSRVQ